MSLASELKRKGFHMLSLAYLAAYELIGYPAVLPWLAGWSAVVLAVELGRLALPRLNDFLFGLFGSLSRAEERARASGILHTTLGAAAVIWRWGDRPGVVRAAILCVALGDAAAALVGKSLGRIPLGRKTLEGSLACFLACAASCRAFGFPWPAVLAAAAAGSVIEALPTTGWLNDNLWMPIGVALALTAF